MWSDHWASHRSTKATHSSRPYHFSVLDANEAAPRIFQLSSGPNRFQCQHEKKVQTRNSQPSSGPHHFQCRHEKTRPNTNFSNFQWPEPLSVSTRKKRPNTNFSTFQWPEPLSVSTRKNSSQQEFFNLPVARTTFSVDTKKLVPTRIFQPSSAANHFQCRHEKSRHNTNFSTFQWPEPLSVPNPMQKRLIPRILHSWSQFRCRTERHDLRIRGPQSRSDCVKDIPKATEETHCIHCRTKEIMNAETSPEVVSQKNPNPVLLGRKDTHQETARDKGLNNTIRRELKRHHEEQLNRDQERRFGGPPAASVQSSILLVCTGVLNSRGTASSADNSRRFCPFSSTFLLSSSSSSSSLSVSHRRTETLVPSTPSPAANDGTTRREERHLRSAARCGRSAAARQPQTEVPAAPRGGRFSPRMASFASWTSPPKWLSSVSVGQRAAPPCWRCGGASPQERRSLRRSAAPLLRSPSMEVVEVRSKHVHAMVANGVQPS